MFTLYRIGFITVWKSYRIGFLFTLKHKFASWFSYRIATNSTVIRYMGKVFIIGPSKICGRQPLNKLKWYGLYNRPYHFKSFKGRFPQILLGLFLNTLSHISDRFSKGYFSSVDKKRSELNEIQFNLGINF